MTDDLAAFKHPQRDAHLPTIGTPDVCELVMYSKTYGIKRALFDFDQLDKVMDGGPRWYSCRYRHTFYVIRTIRDIHGKERTQLLHRLIMSTPAHLLVDHIDHNGLNCRLDNLRNVTHAQNLMNQKKWIPHSSQYKGVSWHKPKGKWQARIQINGKEKHLGWFTNEEDARAAYNIASKHYHGEHGLCS